MKDYLNGYLSVLPSNQRKRIIDLILSNENIILGMTEEDYEKLAVKLSADRSLLTTFNFLAADKDIISSDQFNTFHSQVYGDMSLLLGESDLIEEAIVNYEYLHTSELNYLQREINALKERIENLKLASNDKSRVTTYTENFSKSSNMESSPDYSYMYKDRDGTTLRFAEILSINTKNILSSATLSSIDRLRDNANLVASISIDDYRGQPVSQILYPISNAIDNSFISFWGEVVLSDQAININMDDGATTIPPGGALTKLSIELPKAVMVNEISITPFSVYPLEVACIKYERDPRNYEEPKYIVYGSESNNWYPPTESENVMIFKFQSIVAKKFTFYLRQRNYTTNVYTINKAQKDSQELWSMITANEMSITLDGLTVDYNPTVEQNKIDEWDGWAIYLNALANYKVQVQAYIDSINSYNAQYNTNIVYNLPDWVKQLPGLNFGGVT